MIYVEGKPDLTLVQALIQFPRREIAHELKGKYEVLKRLSNLRNARAMVDERPRGKPTGLPRKDAGVARPAAKRSQDFGRCKQE
jgi:hypothetical protein